MTKTHNIAGMTLGDTRPELFVGISALEDRLGYKFVSRGWLCEALTHRSALVSEGFSDAVLASERLWNERLEFLGDSVLGLVVTEYLISLGRSMSEGDLSRIRAALVCEGHLAELARTKWDLGGSLVLGQSERRSGGSEKPSLLADAVEAVIGAVFSDGGWACAKSLVLRLFEEAFAGDVTKLIARDYKTQLQEVVQAVHKETPTYKVVESRGEAHAPEFEVVVHVNGEMFGRGVGSNKKQAAQQAAAEALRKWEERRV